MLSRIAMAAQPMTRISTTSRTQPPATAARPSQGAGSSMTCCAGWAIAEGGKVAARSAAGESVTGLCGSVGS